VLNKVGYIRTKEASIITLITMPPPTRYRSLFGMILAGSVRLPNSSRKLRRVIAQRADAAIIAETHQLAPILCGNNKEKTASWQGVLCQEGAMELTATGQAMSPSQ